MKFKDKALSYYEANESKIDLGFFVGGFIFDIITLSDIDDPISIVQQIVYLSIIGFVLTYEILVHEKASVVPKFFQKAWDYRQLAVHFFLGSLLSIYSLFFLKSSSIFSSIVFVLVLLGLMIANEMKAVKESVVDLKVALFVVCLFSFLSTVVPVVWGQVGWFPFILTLVLTSFLMFLMARLIQKKLNNDRAVRGYVVIPSAGVLGVIFLFYLLGLMPPVPLAVKNMGIYHDVKKENGQYIVSYERPWWKFWQSGDQDFVAEPGDKIFIFSSIYSPAKFNDTVIFHWSLKEKSGWKTTDKVPMRLVGGRKEGFRGFGTKEKFVDGQWRVSLETTDGSEIGRIYFNISKVTAFNPERTFKTEIY